MATIDDILKEAQKLFEERRRDSEAPITNVNLFQSLERDVEHDLVSKKHQFASIEIGVSIVVKNSDQFTIRVQNNKTTFDVIAERRDPPRLCSVGLVRDPGRGGELNQGELKFFNDERAGKDAIYEAMSKAVTTLLGNG